VDNMANGLSAISLGAAHLPLLHDTCLSPFPAAFPRGSEQAIGGWQEVGGWAGGGRTLAYPRLSFSWDPWGGGGAGM
jgi:hypothetical protein